MEDGISATTMVVKVKESNASKYFMAVPLLRNKTQK
jgi:hypothetical protein